MHQENKTEEDHLFWIISPVTGSITACAKKGSEYICSNVGGILIVINNWTEETKHYDNYM